MRFTTAVPLGRGATGEVVRAWDPELEREVALKILRRDDPALARRMQREARLQARVDHPNVCRVFDVGETDEGRPYIAMEYVPGRPLDEAAAAMTREQRVAVMQRVAEAVHAAHAVGLVHRDLKPANILVGEVEGRLEPKVLDFGIARDDAAESLTVTGQLLGTPDYMAPEQARGELAAVDRRSDVFSLGAILYAVLAGRPPFAADSAAETLARVLACDPTPLRTRAPSVPRDLEAVAMRCLEADPGRRYASAAELADDLGRVLAGEPVVARRASVLRRGLQRLRRHPVAGGALAVAAAALLAGAGIAVRAQHGAAERARLAAEAGRRVERLRLELQLDAMAPPHDVRPARRRVTELVASLEREAATLPRRLRGPLLAAAGDALLAMGRADDAVGSLRRAAAAGYEPPEVQGSLGRALALEGRRELEAVSRIDDPDRRLQRRREVEQGLLEPARERLAAAVAAGSVDDLAAPRLALLDGRWEDTVDRAEALLARVPWRSDAAVLAGDAHAARSDEARDDADLEAALVAAHEAVASYRRATEIAPSDPLAAARLAGGWRRVVDLSVALERDPGEPWRALRETVTAATALDPDQAEPRLELAGAANAVAGYLLDRGREAGDVLAVAEDAARQVTRSEPELTAAWLELGRVGLRRSQAAAARGDDPVTTYREGEAALRRAIELAPGEATARIQLGQLLEQWAFWEQAHGVDPEARILAAIEVLEDAARLAPTWRVWQAVSEASMRRSSWLPPGSEEAAAARARALEAARRGVEVAPDQPRLRLALANALLREGLDRFDTGGDPAPFYAEARVHLEAGEQLAPDLWQLPYTLGLLEMRLGEAADAAGDQASALSSWRAAAAANQRATVANPDQALCWFGLGNAHVRIATRRFEWGERGIGDEARQGLEAHARALELDPTLIWSLASSVEARLVMARDALAAGRDPSAELARARLLLERARKVDADFATLGALEKLLESTEQAADAMSAAS